MKSLKLASSLELCVISAESPKKIFGHLDIIRAALLGGAPSIQLRIKDKNTREFLELALEAKSLCDEADALFIINDRVDIALASGADGVHLGQDDLPYLKARELLGANAIVGISASNYDEAMAADELGADYIGFGPVFPTISKDDAAVPAGLAELKKVTTDTSTPVLAIGGIGPDNVDEVIAAGAAGIAVISAVANALHPELQVQGLLKTVRDALQKE